MTRRQQLERLTAGSWPKPELPAAVECLADELIERGCAVTHAEVTSVIHPLYAVSATDAEKDVVRRKLLVWCDWLDALDLQDQQHDGYRRCGPAPAADDAVS